MEPNNIGKFIYNLRKKNNLTQKEFAELFGVTYQAVSKWEKGKNIPDILILKEICKKFNVDINEILNEESHNSKKKKKFYFYIIIILIILITILLLLLFTNKFKNEEFKFQPLKSTCSNFDIYGIITYNCTKSIIYIPKIEYCSDKDNVKYKKIECILYESKNNLDIKISTHTSEENANITLREFLNNISFHIDQYESLCKKSTNSSIFLQINAYDKYNNITSYKVPLEFDDNSK